MSDCRRRSCFATLAFAALSVSWAGMAFGESVMVKRKYIPGRVSYIESRTDVVQEISGLPMPPMKFDVKQLYGLLEKVEPGTEGDMKITLTYDRAVRTVEAPMMGNLEFDTDDPDYEEAAPQLGTILKPMIGMAMTMEIDKAGKVVSFSGMDAINKKISELAVASMHWEQMKEEFTNERGRQDWGEDPLLIYPNKKVKVGDTWEASSIRERPRVGTVVTDRRYKVERIGTENGRQIVEISVVGVISKKKDVKDDAGAEKPAEKEGDADKEGAEKAAPEAEIKGSLFGTAIYDVERGRIVKNTGGGEFDVKIPLSQLIPNLPESEEPQFAIFNAEIKTATLILSEKQREAQRLEAKKKAEMRRKAEEEEDEEEEDEEDE